MTEIVGACLSQFHDDANSFELLLAYSDGREIGHVVSRVAAQEIAAVFANEFEGANPSPAPAQNVTTPTAAYTIDFTGCDHMSRDVARIERIAAAGAKGPTDVVYLYDGKAPAPNVASQPPIGDQEWCQPGDIRKRQFLVTFDDPDCRNSVFDDETEARSFWAKACLNWNCYLFGALPVEQPSSPPAESVIQTLNNIKAAIVDGDPVVITDTVWMPEDIIMGCTLVDYIDLTIEKINGGEQDNKKASPPLY